MVKADAEHILIEMPWRDEMISNPTLPSMHGGILASLIDLTGFYTVLASGSMSKSTADLRVDYHRAASRQTLLAEGRLIKAGRSRSEEHTSELQSLMRISYAVFCLKKKK